MLIACQDKQELEDTKRLLMSEFNMKVLGNAKKILGMEISRDRAKKVLKLSQTSYINKILKTFSMDDCKHVKTPLATHIKISSVDSPTTDSELRYMEKNPYANVVGSMMYLIVCSRPDISYLVSVISRFNAKERCIGRQLSGC